MSVLSTLLRIKIASFFFIVTDQNCQLYQNLGLFLPIPGRKVPKLTIINVKMPNLSFILPIPGPTARRFYTITVLAFFIAHDNLLHVASLTIMFFPDG